MKENYNGFIPVQEELRKLTALGSLDRFECEHLKNLKDIKPSSNRCEECIKMGDTWVHLRLCLICGHVGCCDDSKNKHATKHYHATGHPLIISYEEGEEWMWCYADEVAIIP